MGFLPEYTINQVECGSFSLITAPVSEKNQCDKVYGSLFRLTNTIIEFPISLILLWTLKTLRILLSSSIMTSGNFNMLCDCDYYSVNNDVVREDRGSSETCMQEWAKGCDH